MARDKGNFYEASDWFKEALQINQVVLMVISLIHWYYFYLCIYYKKNKTKRISDCQLVSDWLSDIIWSHPGHNDYWNVPDRLPLLKIRLMKFCSTFATTYYFASHTVAPPLAGLNWEVMTSLHGGLRDLRVNNLYICHRRITQTLGPWLEISTWPSRSGVPARRSLSVSWSSHLLRTTHTPCWHWVTCGCRHYTSPRGIEKRCEMRFTILRLNATRMHSVVFSLLSSSFPIVVIGKEAPGQSFGHL